MTTQACADRRVLTYRGPRPDDAAALREFYRALSDSSRRLRFMGTIARLSSAFIDRLTGDDHAWGGALMALDGDTVVAIARFDLAANAEFAEFAIVVADAYQRQGLGRDLMTRLMAAARAGGVRRLYGEVLAENVRMLKFVRGLGFSVHCDPLDRRVMLVSLDLTV